MRSVIFAVSTALTVLLSACTGAASSVPVNTVSSVSASTSITTSSEVDSAVSENASSETGNIQTGLVREQTLDSTEGLIHYSYYLPEDYDPTRKYPMMVVMPGYNMMWFGESSGSRSSERCGEFLLAHADRGHIDKQGCKKVYPADPLPAGERFSLRSVHRSGRADLYHRQKQGAEIPRTPHPGRNEPGG